MKFGANLQGHMKRTLNVLSCSVYDKELKKAQISYDEPMTRKLACGNVIENWIKKSKLKSRRSSEESLSLSGKSRRSYERKSSYSSSISSQSVKRREKFPLAQLKTKQLFREQKLKQKMT